MIACVVWLMDPNFAPGWFIGLMLAIGLAGITLAVWVGLVTLRWIGRSLWPERHGSDRVNPGA